MRIISGTRKKLTLYGPETSEIRPTTDRAKESLFNLLNVQVPGSEFWDLFSGSGSIALEAKSRGAENVIAVDHARIAEVLIKKNIEKADLQVNFSRQRVETFLKNTNRKADIIFLDPPFTIETEEVMDYLKLIFERKLLSEDGIIVIERKSSKKNEEIFSKEFNDVEVRKYGKVSFILMGR